MAVPVVQPESWRREAAKDEFVAQHKVPREAGGGDARSRQVFWARLGEG